ncbi:nicotinate-nucleotide adenylyltransferase [Metabacillus sp. KIGAM252]|uniref:Probable nicotinate-nucleotide adenylyltransferase n=1 Tax=Metabacillus flavus TaxID=2823519 RepID=A0ABS5LGE6_9BACI|nr:nicotinate-nucleotide adenylyltransferase [Metabacillus flavus]MBS2969772.1 nicotinate-nucleotide adenylyltransferase [Metabacillus flavus]
MKEIGIFGGTFDPPHFGHLLMASEVKAALSLDEIWFLPNSLPPHKQDEEHSSPMDRCEMLELAISGKEGFLVEPIELERTGPSYTYDTIVLLREKYPEYHFSFIIGADMIEYLPKWNRVDQLLSMVRFVGVGRPGYSPDTAYSLTMVDVPQFDVSSSMIRHRIEQGITTSFLLQDKIMDLIKEKGLYGK